MKFKVGVGLKSLTPQALLGMIVADAAYKAFNLDMTITSVNDSTHMEKSKHYKGLAFDIRTKGTGMAKRLHGDIQRSLAHIGYDVILEDLEGDNEHIHVEYDPKA